MKWLTALLALVIFFGIVYYLVFGRALSQDENHLAIAIALPRVAMTSAVVKVGDRYLAKDAATFEKLMQEQGFEFVEQMGAGYIFKKDNGRYVATSQMYSSYFMLFTEPKAEAWECNADGLICPDGSTVGRTGPKCEFAACPPADTKVGTVTTYLGGRATALNLTVNPREVVSDSRCAEGVQCIWAGTTEVRAAVETKVAHGEHVFKLGEAKTVGDFSVTLTEVTPYPKAGEPIAESSYRFTFTIEKVR